MATSHPSFGFIKPIGTTFMKADGRAWKADTLEAAPRAVRDGYRMMEYWLARQVGQPLPRLIEVRRVPAGSSFEDYIFEIASGLTIAMWRGPAGGSAFWRMAVDEVVVADCLAPLLKPQADRYLRELDARIDAARRQGFSVRLLRIELEGLERWRDPRKAAFTAAIEMLGTHLRPQIDRLFSNR